MHAEDWLYIEQVNEERETSHLARIEQRLGELQEVSGGDLGLASERIALRVALLDTRATLEWIVARQAGGEGAPEFEWQYRARHSNRALQRGLLREALQADPGHPLLVRAMLPLAGEDTSFDPAWVRQQLELAVARAPDDLALKEQLAFGLLGEWGDLDAAVQILPRVLRAGPSCPQAEADPWNTAASQLVLAALASLVRESRPCWWPLRHKVLSRAQGQLRLGARGAVADSDDEGLVQALGEHWVRNPQQRGDFIDAVAGDLESAECIQAPESPRVRALSLLPHLVELEVHHCDWCTALIDPSRELAGASGSTAALRSREPGLSRLWLQASPDTLQQWQVQAARRVDPRGLHPPPPWLGSEPLLVQVRMPPAFDLAPGAPVAFQAEDTSPYAIRLAWEPADAWAYGFELRECAGYAPGTCVRTALIGFDQREFEYTHAAPGEARRYELRAFNPEGVSPPAILEWTAARDEELEQLHEAWRSRQPQRVAEAAELASRPSAVLALASHGPSLSSDPWRLYGAIEALPASLQPDPGAEGLWRPIESTAWAQRCTSREELVSLPLETFGFRLEWQGRVRLEDAGEVDVFWITDHDTQCDFNACPAWVAFGVLPGTECYAHRGWAHPVPADLEPAIGTGWERGTAGERAYVWCNNRGRVHAFTTCRLSENALPSLRPPLVERWGHALEACQGWPLARE